MGVSMRIGVLLITVTVAMLAGCENEQDVPASKQGAPLVAGLPDFTRLVEVAAPAVVNISTVQDIDADAGGSPLDDMPELFQHFFERFGRGMSPEAPPPSDEAQSLGSGFFISDDGYVLTNHHVVADADEILVRLQDRREFTAELVGADPQSDIALLRVDGEDFPAVALGSSSDLKVGEWVVAIGAPFGFDSSVTAGIVSAKGRSLPEDSYVPFIQTDVAINPGNSGGPLFNLYGQVVGINSQIFSRSGGYMGVSFAIPMDMALDVVSQLKNDGVVSRGWLGVLIQDVDRPLAESFGLAQPHGALVAQVLENGPAEAGGLLPGDIIIAFNEQPIYRSSELPRWVGIGKPGSEAELTIVREGEEIRLTVTLGQLPDSPHELALHEPADVLGLEVREADNAELTRYGVKHGVEVLAVEDGPAALAGIEEGDILVTLGGKPITSKEALAAAVASLPAGATVAVLVHGPNGPRFLALKLP